MGFFSRSTAGYGRGVVCGHVGEFFSIAFAAMPAIANLFLAGMSGTFLLAAHLALQTFLAGAFVAGGWRRRSIAISSRTMCWRSMGEYEAGSTMSFLPAAPGADPEMARSSNLWYGSYFPDTPQIFDDTAAFQAVVVRPRSAYFCGTETDQAPKLPGEAYVIAARGGKEILSNQPNGSGGVLLVSNGSEAPSARKHAPVGRASVAHGNCCMF